MSTCIYRDGCVDHHKCKAADRCLALRKDADVDRLTLLPCPFCGEPPREHYGEHSEEHWVACESESCDVCPTTSGGSIESARRAWNRRQSLSQEAVRDEVLGYCWLIEHENEGHLYYWTANPTSSLVGPWTTDPFRAVRFHRKEDAEDTAVGYAGAAWKVVCHHFDDAIKCELEPQIDAAEEEIRRLRTWISDDELAAYDALKREPNAAVVQQPLQPVDPERVHAGWNKGEPVYLDEPAPAAPDVTEGDRLLQSPGASDE